MLLIAVASLVLVVLFFMSKSMENYRDYGRSVQRFPMRKDYIYTIRPPNNKCSQWTAMLRNISKRQAMLAQRRSHLERRMMRDCRHHDKPITFTPQPGKPYIPPQMTFTPQPGKPYILPQMTFTPQPGKPYILPQMTLPPQPGKPYNMVHNF
jgi:hypothetical protein